MRARADSSLRAFAKRIGYEFRDLGLLRMALTHASARSGKRGDADNQRLEFLGDRVLGLAIAELLAELFPDAPEGDLARRLNVLVRKETCAVVAQDIDLGKHVVLSSAEAGSGGRAKATILADACEAVLGAVFLDGGFEPARALVRLLWSPHVTESDPVPTDAKSALQEWAQGRGLALPQYVEVDRLGPDHLPSFTTEVRIEGLAPAQGRGANKRAAEQAAAGMLLVREGVWDEARNDGAG